MIINNTLSVQVLHAPKRAKKVAADTARLIHKVLEQFNYRGKWKITLSSQITKRIDFKFQVVGRKDTAIQCRTKSGDNGTCFETLLFPPPGYFIDQVFANLRTVLPSGEMLQIPDARVEQLVVPKPIPQPIPQPVVQETKPKQEEPPKIQEEPAPKKTLPPPGPKDPPMQVPLIKKDRGFIQTQAPQPIPPAPPAIKDVSVLILSPDIDSVSENDKALDRGLLAVCLGIHPVDSSIQRQLAIKLLVQELGLSVFVKSHENYSNPVKTATIVIKGLVKEGLLSRWMAGARKERRVRATTKGYLLTPQGRSRLELIQTKNSSLYNSVQSKLFCPEKVIIREQIDIPPEDEEEQPIKRTPKTASIESVEPLFREYEKAKTTIDDWNSLIAEIEEQRQPINERVAGIEEKTKATEKELADLKLAKTALLDSRKKLDDELKTAKLAQREDERLLDGIKTKLQSLLN